MNKGCYTCRRRRVICDNAQPTCRKCRNAGKECLGYQKPLVWVKGGVASRGKMMGRSFDDTKKLAPDSKQQFPAEAHDPTFNTSFGFFSVVAPSDAELQGSGIQPNLQTNIWDHGMPEVALAGSEEPDTRVVHVPSVTPPEYIPAPWGLVDPLLKDLGPLSRHYIFHYNQHMVGDFALYSQFKNPFRDIISLVGHSPVLAHSISAMGALHYSLVSDSDTTLMPWSTNNLETVSWILTPEEIENVITPAASRRPSSKVYQQFLEFKQRALHQLSMDLDSPVMQRDNRTLAGIVVLALLDLFESGSGAWSYHIEGAKKLIKSRPKDELPKGILEGLETFAIDGCLIMEIMGSTLARCGALSPPFYSWMGPVILKRLEETSWVGCPAYLLEVIFFIHALWYPESEPAISMPLPAAVQPGQPLTPESFAALLQGIRNFDPVAWAEEMQAFFFIPDLSSRIALAAAYQAAVYLYTSRVLSRPRPGFSPPWSDLGLPADHERVATDLLAQICLIPVSDPHFKCLIWPSFIAGAESHRLSQRALVLEKLGTIYQAVTSVNVRNAAWVLRLMWQKHDLKRRERRRLLRPFSVDDSAGEGAAAQHRVNSDDDENDDDEYDDMFDWVEELDHSRLDWLFI